ncbi:C1A family cysteine protease [Methanococcus maripaludis]|uniref:C1A family cysteine protease n=1 Tax=Methanococcus maripaludis TaxID=39152 RepID=A0A7J9P4V7_METMI|nr:C1 family peptidase [Methanococcus maripaludis]MBA2858233.1 C1A family cysteine protease [Methanococcus maripaludis]
MNFFKKILVILMLLLVASISANFSESIDDGTYIYHNFTKADAEKIGVDENTTDYGKNETIKTFSDSDDDIYVMGCFLPTKEELMSMSEQITVVEGVSETANLSNNTYLDLSKDPCFPMVGDQGKIGSCASWAIVYYANSYLQAKIHNYDLKGADSLKCFNPMWAYNKINDGKNEGSGLIGNLNLISRLGSATYETMPPTNNYTIWGDYEAWLEAPQYRITGYEISSTNNTDVMKSWLNEGSVIIIAMRGEDIFTFDNNSILSDFDQSHDEADHAQAVIGYDDSISEDNETGAFKVMNSWGANWSPNGDGSYYITYKAMANLDYTTCYRITGAVYNTSDSHPELIGVVEFDSENKGTKDQNITFGIGNKSNISGSVDIYEGMDENGGNGSMPDFIAVDLTDWKSEFENSLNNTGKGYYFANFSNGTGTSIISEFGIIKYSSYPNGEEINTLNSYACNNSTLFKFYSKTAPKLTNSSIDILDGKVIVSINADDVDDDLWGVNVCFDGLNEYYSLTRANQTFNTSFNKSMFSYGEHYAIFEAFDGSGNTNKSEKAYFEILAPTTTSRSTTSHHSSDLSDGIDSGTIKRAISNSNVIYGSDIDEEFALNLRENVENGNNYELSKDTIIVGGPESNGFADKYNNEFEIQITNEYPGENRGVIQVQTIEVRDGNIIKPYQVIYIAGSDRFGTLGALEYFKTLDELPKGPITVEWNDNGIIVV